MSGARPNQGRQAPASDAALDGNPRELGTLAHWLAAAQPRGIERFSARA